MTKETKELIGCFVAGGVMSLVFLWWMLSTTHSILGGECKMARIRKKYVRNEFWAKCRNFDERRTYEENG